MPETREGTTISFLFSFCFFLSVVLPSFILFLLLLLQRFQARSVFTEAEFKRIVFMLKYAPNDGK